MQQIVMGAGISDRFLWAIVLKNSAKYRDVSIYNVNGVRLTLPEYEQAMNISRKSSDIQMGNFNNMILSGELDGQSGMKPSARTGETGETSYGTTMEFARFKDFGEKGA